MRQRKKFCLRFHGVVAEMLINSFKGSWFKSSEELFCSQMLTATFMNPTLSHSTYHSLITVTI